MPSLNGQSQVREIQTGFEDIEIKDMIGNPPGWILRSGIGVMLIVASIALALCFIIKYPEKIQAPIVVTTENPPLEIVAKTNGKIDLLFVKDKQLVETGDRIAYIHNSAQFQDVNKLEQFFEAFDKAKYPVDYLALNFPENLSLGEFQGEATSFEQRFNEFKIFLRQRNVEAQMQTLEAEIGKLTELNELIETEQDLFTQEMKFNEKEKNRYKNLNESKTVSDSEYEGKQVKTIQDQRQLEGMKREIIRNQIRVQELKTKQLTLGEEQLKSQNDFVFALVEIRNRTITKIVDWKEKYFLRAPATGQINLLPQLVEGTTVQAEEAYAHVVPGEKAGDIVARATVNITGIGKIEPGDRAMLRLAPYPYKEYGSIESQVKDISILPSQTEENTFYTISIPIGKHIETNYHKAIPYRPNMTGMALIITKDKSLFHRIFEQFTSLLKN